MTVPDPFPAAPDQHQTPTHPRLAILTCTRCGEIEVGDEVPLLAAAVLEGWTQITRDGVSVTICPTCMDKAHGIVRACKERNGTLRRGNRS